MKIAISAEHANSVQATGVEHYARELILALARIDSSNDYVLYLRTPPREWCKDLPANFKIKFIPFRLGWTQFRLSLAIAMDRPDALLVPSFSMPLIHPRNSVVTIHDLAWLLFPETETAKQRLSLTFTHYFSKIFARKLIAVSEATKRDLLDKLHIPGHRIEVVHHGFSHLESISMSSFFEKPKPVAENVVPEPPKPFIVCLGTLQPRKNLLRLIDAFILMKQRSGLPHSLVIAGRQGWMCEDIVKKINATSDVIYLGYVEDRLKLLKEADLLVQPSLYEGFGLSVLDAFSQQVPVACSNISSLPEIVGDAAEFFDPYNVESIAYAMTAVVGDRNRAEQLRKIGWDRLGHFHWDTCAKQTLAVLEEQSAKTGTASNMHQSNKFLISKTAPPNSD